MRHTRDWMQIEHKCRCPTPSHIDDFVIRPLTGEKEVGGSRDWTEKQLLLPHETYGAFDLLPSCSICIPISYMAHCFSVNCKKE
ncbi:hypothetical protein SUGI_0580160 [Cryptomeria japonica]|nr:hypothetical protein SUGI_0580160 [Cryptomeria japonica]